MNRVLIVWLFVATAILDPTSALSDITIQTVPVGNPGNPSDNFGAGGVDYNFRMGTYEVTVGQYATFLNAVAASDTYGLYSTGMATDLKVAGIARNGAPGGYSYSVIGSPNHPVTYVSWGNAVRFANWLYNGQPTGPQNATTTEDGSYTLNGRDDFHTTEVTRNPGATWVIPSLNEWMKAGYYDPRTTAEGGPVQDGHYWFYPNSSGASVFSPAPFSAPPPGTNAPDPSNTMNYRYAGSNPQNGYNNGFAVTGSNTIDQNQNYLTDVGSYITSKSPSGTFDQGGNVSEWTEELEFSNFYRMAQGGNWELDDSGLIYQRSPFSPSTKDEIVGFRVALIPEPSSIALAAFGFVGLLGWGWRRNHRG